MPLGAHAVPGNGMIKAVFDANVLVSAFLSRDNPGGVSSELLHFVVAGAIDLHLSIEIVDEVIRILLSSMRAQRRYRYSRSDAEYRATLMMLATIIDDPSPTPGAVLHATLTTIRLLPAPLRPPLSTSSPATITSSHSGATPELQSLRPNNSSILCGVNSAVFPRLEAETNKKGGA